MKKYKMTTKIQSVLWIMTTDKHVFYSPPSCKTGKSVWEKCLTPLHAMLKAEINSKSFLDTSANLFSTPSFFTWERKNKDSPVHRILTMRQWQIRLDFLHSCFLLKAGAFLYHLCPQNRNPNLINKFSFYSKMRCLAFSFQFFMLCVAKTHHF